MPRFLDATVTYTPRLSAKEQQLLALRDRMTNLEPLMTQVIAPEAVAMLERHWDSKGEAFGHPWAEWKPSTLRARLRKGNASKGILRDEDHLHDSLFAAVRSARRLQSFNGGLRLSLAPDDPAERRKFTFHMRGVKRGGRLVMPIRQPVPSPLPRSFRDLVRASVRDYLLTGRLRGAGGQFIAAGPAQ